MRCSCFVCLNKRTPPPPPKPTSNATPKLLARSRAALAADGHREAPAAHGLAAQQRLEEDGGRPAHERDDAADAGAALDAGEQRAGDAPRHLPRLRGPPVPPWGWTRRRACRSKCSRTRGAGGASCSPVVKLRRASHRHVNEVLVACCDRPRSASVLGCVGCGVGFLQRGLRGRSIAGPRCPRWRAFVWSRFPN